MSSQSDMTIIHASLLELLIRIHEATKKNQWNWIIFKYFIIPLCHYLRERLRVNKIHDLKGLIKSIGSIYEYFRMCNHPIRFVRFQSQIY